jgi:hypothetical protein
MQNFESLKRTKLPTKTITVEGEDTHLIGLTAAEFGEYNALRDTEAGRKISGALLIYRSVTDESGRKIGSTLPYDKMDDITKSEVVALRDIPLVVNEALLQAIFDINGLSEKPKTPANPTPAA